MGTRLFVGNLSFDTTEDALLERFAADGRQVVRVRVMLDRETGRSRGFAFVDMATEGDAKGAIEALDGVALGGRPMRVSEAMDRDAGGGDRRPGPGGPRPGNGAPRPGGGRPGGDRPWSGGDRGASGERPRPAPWRDAGSDRAPRDDGPPRDDRSGIGGGPRREFGDRDENRRGAAPRFGPDRRRSAGPGGGGSGWRDDRRDDRGGGKRASKRPPRNDDDDDFDDWE